MVEARVQRRLAAILAADVVGYSPLASMSAVARGFDHTARMFRNLGIDQFAATSLERCESTFLVSTHQARPARSL